MSRTLSIFKSEITLKYSINVYQSFPLLKLPEICFAGRSNVGKSSLLNAITKRKKIASISSKPGHTRKINFFDVSGKFTLVDLPGYGYARIPKSKSNLIGELIFFYLKSRKNLKLAILLIDSRRGLKESDINFINLLNEYNIDYQLVLTKSDKTTNKNIMIIEKSIQESTSIFSKMNFDVISTSTTKGYGIDKLRKRIYSHIFD